MVEVCVAERRTAALSGVGDCDFLSPPLSPDSAGALLRVLLGRKPEQNQTSWTLPVSGGTRHIRLRELADPAAAGGVTA